MDYRRHRLSEQLRSHALLFLIAAVTALIQSQLLPRIFDATVNIVLIAVVVWALISPSSKAAWLAFYAGFTLDLLGLLPLGSHAFGLLMVAALTLLVAARLPTENWLLLLIMVGLGTAWYQSLLFLLRGQFQDLHIWAVSLLVPALVINAVIALPEFLLIRWWYERLPRER